MNKELSIKSLVASILKKVVWIILIPIVCACLMFAATSFDKPTYTTTIQFLAKDSTGNAGTTNAKNAVGGYVELLKSPNTLKKVSDTLLSDYNCNAPVNELQSMISVTKSSDTSAFTVSITYSDPEITKRVAQAIGDVYVAIANENYEEKKTNSLENLSGDSYITNTNKVDVKKSCIIAAALGFIATFAVCFILAYTDKTIRSESEAKKLLELPVIGTIPRWKNG